MWKDYFSFTRKEQYGILALLILILLLIASRLIIPLLLTPFDPSKMVEDVTKIIYLNEENRDELNETVELTVFNPNSVTLAQLKLFGLNSRVANNWQKFIKNGGKFYHPEDVKKIYGLHDSLYLKMKPFMQFGELEQTEERIVTDSKIEDIYIDLNRADSSFLLSLGWTSSLLDTVSSYAKSHWFPRRIKLSYLKYWEMDSFLLMLPTLQIKKSSTAKKYPNVEINSADTSLWAVLPGIGPVISRRIVEYRERLGGFVSTDQLLEVYGFSPILYEDLKVYFIVDSIPVRTININRASVHQMRNHPYIDFYKAKAIFDMRMANGKFFSVDEVMSLKEFEDGDWERIKFYLSVSNQ